MISPCTHPETNCYSSQLAIDKHEVIKLSIVCGRRHHGILDLKAAEENLDIT